MSIIISLDDVDEELKLDFSQKLTIREKKTDFNQFPQIHYCYEISLLRNELYIPIGVWKNYFDKFPTSKKRFPSIDVTCKLDLLTIDTDPMERNRDQDVVFKEGYEKLIKDHYLFLDLHTGFGKTSLGIYFTCVLKLKTCIVCHIDNVNSQWQEGYEKNVEGIRVQKLKNKKYLDPSADVYIVGIEKASHFSKEDFKDIGLVIFDESHVSTKKAIKALLLFNPYYIIGMSATPIRNDGLQKVFNFYFGSTSAFIKRFEVKDFTVIKYNTLFKPTINYRYFNHKSIFDKTTFVNSLACIPERHQVAVNICLKHLKLNSEEKIMIACPRVCEIEGIVNLLEQNNIKYDTFYGEKEKKNIIPDFQVLVAGIKKCGTGTDIPGLTMMILMEDSPNVTQLEGRVRVKNNILYDIVDNSPINENNFKKREIWYKKRGAVIKYDGTEAYLNSLKIKQEKPKRFLKSIKK
jgi:hypothetical protein